MSTFRPAHLLLPLALAALIACAATQTDAPAPSEQPDPQAAIAADWASIRAHRRTELEARRWLAQTRFLGSFTDGGMPKVPTKMIPIDGYDIRFFLAVHAEQVLEGSLPVGWGKDLVFGVHSPALFFGLQGIDLAEGAHLPAGNYLFTLWRAPDGEGFELAVEPASR